MSYLFFKNVAKKNFPILTGIENDFSVYDNITELFHKIVIATNDDEVLSLIKKYKKYKFKSKSKNNELFLTAFEACDSLITIGEAILKDANNYAKKLNLKTEKQENQLLKIRNSQEKFFLQKEIIKNSLNCACVSLFAILKNDLTDNEKNIHFAIQQNRLNVAIQNDFGNQVNYWYSLHWFLRGNVKNATFYLNNLLNGETDKDILLDKNYLIWIKNKLPNDFINFINNYSIT
jgi:hypothetical protein